MTRLSNLGLRLSRRELVHASFSMLVLMLMMLWVEMVVVVMMVRRLMMSVMVMMSVDVRRAVAKGSSDGRGRCERVFVSDERLRVEFEGFAEKAGDSIM